jgi:hypothetical protein
VSNNRPWHYHKSHIPGIHRVYRGASCDTKGTPEHGKLVGFVSYQGERQWIAELFTHIAKLPNLKGKGRTRNEAVCDALCKKGIPYAD